jgi:hypothetical protein
MDASPDDSSHNPYEAPVEVADVRPEPTEPGIKQTTFGNALGRWSLICVGAAIPSFIFGVMINGGDPRCVVEMLLGVITAAVIYAFIDIQPYWRRWMSQRLPRLSIITAFSIRLAVSVVFPVGGPNDMICGLFTVSCVGFVYGGQFDLGSGENAMAPTQAYLTTLLQGAALSVEVFIVGLFVFGILVAYDRFVNR